jgi:hypothetical protein
MVGDLPVYESFDEVNVLWALSQVPSLDRFPIDWLVL